MNFVKAAMTCLALGWLASCGATEQATPDRTPVGDHIEPSEARPDSRPTIQGTRLRPAQPLVPTVVAPGVSTAQQRAAKVFLNFAAAPSAESASRVPFASPSITIRFVGAPDKHVSTAEARDESSWSMRNGVGTTSALFVVSNSIAKNKQAEFLVTESKLPLCSTAEEPGQGTPGAIHLMLVPDARPRCATGFRVGLVLNSEGMIRAVDLSVREP